MSKILECTRRRSDTAIMMRYEGGKCDTSERYDTEFERAVEQMM